MGGYLCRAAILPVSTSNTFDWLAAELPWDPTLLGTVQAPCQGVMWLGDLAQFAGCLVQPLLGEAIQLVLRPHSVLVLRDGDTLNLIAERYGTTLLLPGYLPSTPLPAGEWIYLPARRAATGSSCRHQAQVLDVGLEVAVAEQQRQVGLDAGGGDDPVDRLWHRDAPAA